MGQTIQGGEIKSMGMKPLGGIKAARSASSAAKQARLDRKLDSKRAALQKIRAYRVKTTGNAGGVPPRKEMKLSNKIQKLRDKGARSDANYFGGRR
jgi:hypothetical protein